MASLLFPGRHHLLSVFQKKTLDEILGADPGKLRDADGRPLELSEPIDEVIWAVTSANHANTRRNPLPAHRREVAIESFSRDLAGSSYVYMIDDVGRSDRFAEYIIKKIEVESDGRFRITPEETVLGCSTPEVISLFRKLGFQILPFELESISEGSYRAETPFELMNALVSADGEGEDVFDDPSLSGKVSEASRKLYSKYGFVRLVKRLYTDPLLGADGDLTKSRDYNVYIRSFDEGAERKYEQIRPFVRSGRIVDIGCCTGSLIRQMTMDDRLRESDFYGIEVARQLFDECVHRKAQGHFANDNVFFYQRNISEEPLFSDRSVMTFITASLTHEIASYQGLDALHRFCALLRRQLAFSGRWINLDVLGPDDPDQEVLLCCNPKDGDNPPEGDEGASDRQGRALRAGLSTRARFLRFARDFRREEGYNLEYQPVEMEGNQLFRLRMVDACEFMSKKDYIDNWYSEMHERFCFFGFNEWKKAVETAGFSVHPASRAFSNEWILHNRYRGSVALFTMEKGRLAPAPIPPTHILLICEPSGA